MTDAATILELTINELPLSEELRNILHEYEHKTLNDVLDVPVNKWKAYYGFNYHHLKEIAEFIQENGLSSHLKH